jgi:hypothetical protein
MDPNITCRQSNHFICQDGYFISQIKVNITTSSWHTCEDKRIASSWAPPLVGTTKHNKGKKCDYLLPGTPVAVRIRRQCRDVNNVATGKLARCCAGKAIYKCLFYGFLEICSNNTVHSGIKEAMQCCALLWHSQKELFLTSGAMM